MAFGGCVLHNDPRHEPLNRDRDRDRDFKLNLKPAAYWFVCRVFIFKDTGVRPHLSVGLPYGLVGRSYNISEGPGDLGVPEKFTFRWNHAYLVQNCAKNAIQTRKFWEKCMTDCFF